MKRYLGVDLHRTQFTVCTRLENGRTYLWQWPMRNLLVKQRSALKAKINTLLSSEGINLKREALSSKKALDRVLSLPLSPLMLSEARVLVGQIRNLTESIDALEKMIKEEGPKLTGHKNLMSIKGIGPVSAAVLLSVIGDIRDFTDAGKLAAYLGPVPRVQNSNETEHSGRITKQGDKLARTCLVQCALVAKRYSSLLRQAADYCLRSASAWRCNGHPERAYAAERLAKDFAEFADVIRTATLHVNHVGQDSEYK